MAEYLFGFFRELCWTRRPGYSAPLSLEYREIEAWCRLTRRTLAQWELRVLLEMDMTYLEALREKEEAERVPERPIPGETLSPRPLTPELFDSIFNNDNLPRHKRGDA